MDLSPCYSTLLIVCIRSRRSHKRRSSQLSAFSLPRAPPTQSLYLFNDRYVRGHTYHFAITLPPTPLSNLTSTWVTRFTDLRPCSLKSSLHLLVAHDEHALLIAADELYLLINPSVQFVQACDDMP